uniref:Uncharacterized protein n=1 Tax=Eptatretus burgeri TaxID=7764 RepID=A0A8C4QJ54_EPTBU
MGSAQNTSLLLLLLIVSLCNASETADHPATCSKLPYGADCSSPPPEGVALQPITADLEDHFWLGSGCETVCRCSAGELLCCPSDSFVKFTVECLHFLLLAAVVQGVAVDGGGHRVSIKFRSKDSVTD